ncbi:MAG: DNA double-strand break repair nuclease NurA [Halobacteriota archaeon]
MTLDPVHVDGIASLASAIARGVDDADYDDLARRVWTDWLDPLSTDGRVVVEPLDEQRLQTVKTEDIALSDPPFPTVHGLDSGTINPTTFKNGLVLDVAQAAMGAVPTDLELHRSRSLVATVHTNDATSDHDLDWRTYDEGHGRMRVVHAPRVSRYAEGVVHALSLYLSESAHALEHADAVEDLLVLDGPLYPKELLNWQDRDAELRNLTREAKPRSIVANYVRLVERFVERDVPLVGFVKNPATKLVTRTVREKGMDVPWADDTAFFTRLLERRHDDAPTQGRRGRRVDHLTFTNWFVSRGGSDRTFAREGDALGIDRELSPEAYEVTFFVVYDPRDDLLYRVESPYAVTRDPVVRDALTEQLLRDVAGSRGPPEAIQKADELARVSATEKTALRRRLEERLESDSVRNYNDLRWGDE